LYKISSSFHYTRSPYYVETAVQQH